MTFSHLDEKGEARMVDVGDKRVTRREAVAEASVRMKPETLTRIANGDLPKGDVFSVARVAGIMAAKRASDIIPMCHTLPIEHVRVALEPVPPDCVRIEAAVSCAYKTGVEMEALCAASAAALTVYDMCKAVDRGMTVERVGLVKKTGGKSGDYQRSGTE